MPAERDVDAASALVDAIRWNAVRIVDLSILIGRDLPCTWPGSAPFQAYPIREYDDKADPDYLRMIITDEHLGTHIDAPAHYIPPEGSRLPHASHDGWVTSDRIPLDSLIGPAVVIDVRELVGTSGPGMSPAITADWLLEWERTHGTLQPTDFVLFRSGWSRRYARGRGGDGYGWNSVVLKTEPCWPGLDEPAMQLLVERGITVIGTEGGGPGQVQCDAAVHHIGLGNGMTFVERLANLDAVPERGATFAFLPVHWERGSAAPGRAIAFVPSVVAATHHQAGHAS